MKAIDSKVRAVMLVVVLAGIAGIGPQTAFAAVVGTCLGSPSPFTTIQDAINNVPSGSTIQICPGVYREQLDINRALTLTGVVSGTSNGVIISPPASGLVANTKSLSSGNPIAAHVLVDVEGTVNLTDLIVDSAGNNINACAPILVGVFYRGASGTLTRVVTRNQWVGASEGDPNLNGCQTGLGIFAQSGNFLSASVTVQNSSVHDYQKNGITGNEAGTTLTVRNTQVMGQGATNGAAENGIQIGFGAAGTITGNVVMDDVWAPATISTPGNAAAGILLFDAATGSVVVKSNTVGNTQFGIGLVTDTSGLDDGVQVSGNKIVGTRIFDGIDVCTNGNTIQSNTIVNSAESAIHLDASCGPTGNGNTVTGNIVTDATVGVLKDAGVSGNTTTPNSFFATVTTDPVGSIRSRSPYQPVRP